MIFHEKSNKKIWDGHTTNNIRFKKNKLLINYKRQGRTLYIDESVPKHVKQILTELGEKFPTVRQISHFQLQIKHTDFSKKKTENWTTL